MHRKLFRRPLLGSKSLIFRGFFFSRNFLCSLKLLKNVGTKNDAILTKNVQESPLNQMKYYTFYTEQVK